MDRAGSYIVSWSIDVDAENPVDAAEAALQIQRDRTSDATFFTVRSVATNEEWEDVDVSADAWNYVDDEVAKAVKL